MNSMCNDLYNTSFFMKQLVTHEHKVNYINSHKSEFLQFVSKYYSNVVRNTSLYKNMSVDKNVINLNLIDDMKKYIFKEGDNYFIYFTEYIIEKNDENYVTLDPKFDYFTIDCNKNGFISKQTINNHINDFAKSKYKHPNDIKRHNGFIQNLKKKICVNKSTTKNINPNGCPSFGKEPQCCTDKKQYLAQVLIFHPDKNPDCIGDATRKFQILGDLRNRSSNTGNN